MISAKSIVGAMAAILLLTASSTSRSEPLSFSRELSLAQAIELAWEQNLSLRSAESSVEALSHIAAQVRSQWIPRIVAFGTYTLNDHETVLDMSAAMAPLVELFTGLGPLMEELGLEPIAISTDSEPMIIQHRHNYAAGGSVSVDFSPQSIIQYDSANLARRQGETALDQARLQMGNAVTDLYYGLVTLLAVRDVALQNVQMRQMSLEHVQARYEVGTVNQLDLLRAQMALDEASAQVAEIENSYRVLRTQMAAILRTDPDFSVALPVDPPVYTTPAEVWQLAEDQNPSLRQVDIAHELAGNAIEEVDWSWSPTLTASFNVSASRTTAMNDEAVRWNAMLQATWPIFLGGARLAQRGQRSAEQQAAYFRALEVRSSLQTQIDTAFLDRDQLEANLALALRQRDMARAALEMAHIVYEEGSGNQLDLLQAETMVVAAEIEVTTTRISLSRQNATIHSLTGQLWVP